MAEMEVVTPGDVAAVWEFNLPDGPHKVVFEHGTISGKRVILVDNKEVINTSCLITFLFKFSLCPVCSVT